MKFTTLEWVDWPITDDFCNPSGIYRQPKLKNAITPCWTKQPWPHDSNEKGPPANPAQFNFGFARRSPTSSRMVARSNCTPRVVHEGGHLSICRGVSEGDSTHYLPSPSSRQGYRVGLDQIGPFIISSLKLFEPKCPFTPTRKELVETLSYLVPETSGVTLSRR